MYDYTLFTDAIKLVTTKSLELALYLQQWCQGAVLIWRSKISIVTQGHIERCKEQTAGWLNLSLTMDQNSTRFCVTLCSSITVPAAAEEYQAHVAFLLLITKMKSTCCYQGHRHSEHKSRQMPPQTTYLKQVCGFLWDFCVCTGRVGASAYFSSAFCVNPCHRSRFYNMCRRASLIMMPGRVCVRCQSPLVNTPTVTSNCLLHASE